MATPEMIAEAQAEFDAASPAPVYGAWPEIPESQLPDDMAEEQDTEEDGSASGDLVEIAAEHDEQQAYNADAQERFSNVDDGAADLPQERFISKLPPKHEGEKKKYDADPLAYYNGRVDLRQRAIAQAQRATAQEPTKRLVIRPTEAVVTPAPVAVEDATEDVSAVRAALASRRAPVMRRMQIDEDETVPEPAPAPKTVVRRAPATRRMQIDDD